MIHNFDEFELSSNEIDLLIDESDNLFSVYDDIKTNYDTSIGGSDHLDYYFNIESSATGKVLELIIDQIFNYIILIEVIVVNLFYQLSNSINFFFI